MKQLVACLVALGAAAVALNAQTITCMVDGKAVPCSIVVTVDAPVVTPPQPPSKPVLLNTNEPASLTLVREWDFSGVPAVNDDADIPGSNGWKVIWNRGQDDPGGWVVRKDDTTAPTSPTSVFDFVYPQGMVEGTAPATVYTYVEGRELYAAFSWMPSNPTDLGPNGVKIAFAFTGGGTTGQSYLILKPNRQIDAVFYNGLGDTRNYHPNINATTITLGVWHNVEWHQNLDTGLLKWWVDGVLQGSYAGVTNAAGFDMFQFSPTFGGNLGATKAQTDHYYFDHVRLSVR